MPANTGIRKKRTLKTEELRELLKEEVRKSSQTAWANEHGISLPYVNDVLHGRKRVPDMIAGALGYVPILRYKKKYRQYKKVSK